MYAKFCCWIIINSQSAYTFSNLRSYVMRSREISRNSNMWHFQLSIWLSAHTERYILLKTSPELVQGFKVMSNWRILRTIENNGNSYLCLAISQQSMLPDFRLILLDRNTYIIFTNSLFPKCQLISILCCRTP